MSDSSKGSTYLDLKNGDTIAKIDQDKLKKFAEHIKICVCN